MRRVVAHENVDAAFDKGGADAAGKRRVDTANDLNVQSTAVCGLVVEFGDCSLRILLVFVGEANNRVRGGSVEDGGGDGSAALEDGLWVGGVSHAYTDW